MNRKRYGGRRRKILFFFSPSFDTFPKIRVTKNRQKEGKEGEERKKRNQIDRSPLRDPSARDGRNRNTQGNLLKIV